MSDSTSKTGMDHVGQRPTWAEIDLGALTSNLHLVMDHVGPAVSVMAVVKANAYGHGAVECARRLESAGADWFGVALPEEGIELRQVGITKSILCDISIGIILLQNHRRTLSNGPLTSSGDRNIVSPFSSG